METVSPVYPLRIRWMVLGPEQRIRSRAIAHANLLANETHGVITVFTRSMENCCAYDFGCAYIDTVTAIYNALPENYWSSGMVEYRRAMPSYRVF